MSAEQQPASSDWAAPGQQRVVLPPSPTVVTASDGTQLRPAPLLRVNDIVCRFGTTVAVDGLSFQVAEGQITCLLGPSGCGKTTTLRAIAGFEAIQHGRIQLNDQVLSEPGFTLPPEQRRFGMVFQDFALFPHLTVAENVTFGLGRLSGKRRREAAQQLLDTVHLGGMGDRYPHVLSGGQQQRVALARALAPRPPLILMDEPFSNLDVDMREALSVDVRNILKREGISAVLVTHDQHEAFALGDQVGVMCDGQIVQWDTPYNLYHEPANRFVADFIGQGVFIRGTMLNDRAIETEAGIVHGSASYGWRKGTGVEVLLRPDDVVLDPEGPLMAEVVDKAFKGAETLYSLRLSTGARVLSLFPSHRNYPVGARVTVRIAADHLVAFRRDGEESMVARQVDS